jgi:predicted AAA+ superfamily ATPase
MIQRVLDLVPLLEKKSFFLYGPRATGKSSLIRQQLSASCQIINYTKITSDVGFSPTTIREYYQILEDTLVGFLVTPFLKTKKRKPVATSKFYLFDSGITNQMAGIKSIDQNSDLFGRRFEQFIAMELRAYNGYLRKNEPLQFWRAANYEVDFVIGEHTAIEVKATKKINSADLKGLLALKEENNIKNFYLVTQDPLVQNHKGIHCLPWTVLLKNLWGQGYIETRLFL